MTPDLSCAACRTLLPEYVARTLAPAPTAQVTHHLATCARCREELAAIQNLATLMHQPFPGDTPPHGSLVRVMTQVQHRLAEQASANHQGPPGVFRRRPFSLPSAARVAPPYQHIGRATILPLIVVTLVALLAAFILTRPHGASSIASRLFPITATQLHGWDLRAVAFATPDEGWAVGSTLPDSQYPNDAATPDTPSSRPYVTPVLLHFLGGHWFVVPLPPAIAQASVVLTDIRLVSAREGWAIARSQLPPNADGLIVSTLLHYSNGQWTVASQHYPTALAQLAFASPNDGWAVGDSNGGDPEAMVLHYDGTTWIQIHDPALAALSLSAVAVNGPHTLWAAGVQTNGVGPESASPSVLLRYDGTHWTRHALPTTDTTARITALALPSTTEGWAVGTIPGPASASGAGNANQPAQAVVFRFQQGTWKEAGHSQGPKGTDPFGWQAIAFDAPNDGWAVGTAGALLHFTGTEALHPTLLPQAPSGSTLQGISLLSATEGWAVGTPGMLLHLTQGIWQPYQP